MDTTGAIDVLVIGAGVTGLAAAAELAGGGQTVAVAERHAQVGMETSTHNSGVIHAGIYYPKDSLKARLCVEGASLLYQFCATHAIPFDRCGKLIVAASDAEAEELVRLQRRGLENGVRRLELVDQAFMREREPHVVARAALWSPDSGRVEAEALVRTLLRLAEERGVMLLRAAAVSGAAPHRGGFEIHLQGETILARTVVNAAGLFADDVSRLFGGEAFTIYPCRGEYAELKPARREWINGLVYPLPDASGHGLGVHFTRTTGGSVLIGPTAQYQTDKHDYEGARLSLEAFVEPARQIVPEIALDDLTYGGSGIRPKLHPASESFADFMIRRDTKMPALVHAAGIDSPGLTSCLAIARHVRAIVTAS